MLAPMQKKHLFRKALTLLAVAVSGWFLGGLWNPSPTQNKDEVMALRDELRQTNARLDLLAMQLQVTSVRQGLTSSLDSAKEKGPLRQRLSALEMEVQEQFQQRVILQVTEGRSDIGDAG